MRATSRLGVALAVTVLSGCAAEVGAGTESEEPIGSAASELTASAPSLPTEVQNALQHPNSISSQLLDRLFTLEHYVPVGTGRRVHVTETFTIRSWLRTPHRAMLMLPGPLVKGDFYQIPFDGYQGRDRMAKR